MRYILFLGVLCLSGAVALASLGSWGMIPGYQTETELPRNWEDLPQAVQEAYLKLTTDKVLEAWWECFTPLIRPYTPNEEGEKLYWGLIGYFPPPSYAEMKRWCKAWAEATFDEDGPVIELHQLPISLVELSLLEVYFRDEKGGYLGLCRWRSDWEGFLCDEEVEEMIPSVDQRSSARRKVSRIPYPSKNGEPEQLASCPVARLPRDPLPDIVYPEGWLSVSKEKKQPSERWWEADVPEYVNLDQGYQVLAEFRRETVRIVGIYFTDWHCVFLLSAGTATAWARLSTGDILWITVDHVAFPEWYGTDPEISFHSLYVGGAEGLRFRVDGRIAFIVTRHVVGVYPLYSWLDLILLREEEEMKRDLPLPETIFLGEKIYLIGTTLHAKFDKYLRMRHLYAVYQIMDGRITVLAVYEGVLGADIFIYVNGIPGMSGSLAFLWRDYNLDDKVDDEEIRPLCIVNIGARSGNLGCYWIFWENTKQFKETWAKLDQSSRR